MIFRCLARSVVLDMDVVIAVVITGSVFCQQGSRAVFGFGYVDSMRVVIAVVIADSAICQKGSNAVSWST